MKDWISVKDMLPGTATKKVVISTSDGYVGIVGYYKGRFNASSASSDPDTDMDDVVAWMPVPKPYKEEENEDGREEERD